MTISQKKFLFPLESFPPNAASKHTLMEIDISNVELKAANVIRKLSIIHVGIQ